MCFVSILLFGLYLSAYYSFCEVQAVEEEGCLSLVTISELTTLLEGVSDLQTNNETQPNITIEDIYINCLSVGSILGYYCQATYTVHFTVEPGNNGSTLALLILHSVMEPVLVNVVIVLVVSFPFISFTNIYTIYSLGNVLITTPIIVIALHKVFYVM